MFSGLLCLYPFSFCLIYAEIYFELVCTVSLSQLISEHALGFLSAVAEFQLLQICNINVLIRCYCLSGLLHRKKVVLWLPTCFVQSYEFFLWPFRFLCARKKELMFSVIYYYVRLFMSLGFNVRILSLLEGFMLYVVLGSSF